jgi:hypothetical protein
VLPLLRARAVWCGGADEPMFGFQRNPIEASVLLRARAVWWEVQMNQCSVFKGINRGLCAAAGSCSVVEVQMNQCSVLKGINLSLLRRESLTATLRAVCGGGSSRRGWREVV